MRLTAEQIEALKKKRFAITADEYQALCDMALASLPAAEVGKLVEELDALEEKATKGPWLESHGAVHCETSRTISNGTLSTNIFDHESWNARTVNEVDAVFIAAIRNAWPQLRQALSGVDRDGKRLPGKMVRMSLTDPDFDHDLDIYQHGWNAAIDAMSRSGVGGAGGEGGKG